MAVWTVETYYKKTMEEHERLTKDGMTITRKTGWRWGSWTVTTSDDNTPEFEFDFVPGGDGKQDSINMNDCYGNNIEEVEFNESWDGSWVDYDWPEDMEDDEQERLAEFIEEQGFYELEDEEGWVHDDTDFWIWGPIAIKNEQDEIVRIVIADDDGNLIDFKEEN